MDALFTIISEYSYFRTILHEYSLLFRLEMSEGIILYVYRQVPNNKMENSKKKQQKLSLQSQLN